MSLIVQISVADPSNICQQPRERVKNADAAVISTH